MTSYFESPEMQAVLVAGALCLALAGMTMLVYAIYVRHQMIDGRLSLVSHQPRRVAAPQSRPAAVRETLFLAGTLGRMPERERREVVRQMGLFNIPIALASGVFLALQLVLAVALAAAFYFGFTAIPQVRPAILPVAGLIGAVIGWLLPHYWVQFSAKRRADKASEGLPDALEMLVICVEVGLALEDAIDRTVIELRHSNPILAQELATTSADLKVLPTQEAGLARLADRMDIPSVHSVVMTLSQTMRFGTPLAKALRVVASDLRSQALRDLEERANRLPTLLTLPMMLFIMPTIFLIVGGPAVLRLIDTFMR